MYVVDKGMNFWYVEMLPNFEPNDDIFVIMKGLQTGSQRSYRCGGVVLEL